MSVLEFLCNFSDNEKFTFIDNKSGISLICSKHSLIYDDLIPIWKKILSCSVMEYKNHVIKYD